MKNNFFDSYVKESLGNFRPEVPPHIWENIIAEKGRKKPFGFWRGLGALNIAAALMVTLLASGTVYLILKDKIPAEKNSLVKENTGTEKNNRAINIGNINSPNTQGNFVKDQHDVSFQPQTGTNNAESSPQRSHHTGIYGNAAFTINTTPSTNEQTILSTIIANKENYLHTVLINIGVRKMNASFNPRLGTMPSLSKSLFIPCPRAERDAAGNKQYVEIYGGPDYVFRSLSDMAGSTYLEQRKASTKMLFAYSGGIRYTKVFGSGISFRSGINYSRINEGFKLLKGHVIQNVYITDANGDTTGTYTVSGTQFKQATNKYTNIDIPITAGYEFGNGRLHTNINAGVMINIASKKSGFVVDGNGNAVDLNDKQSSAYRYKTNAGVSLTGGISFYYKLNDRLHLLAEPYLRYSLSPVTKSELSFKEKYHTAGLRVGIRGDL